MVRFFRALVFLGMMLCIALTGVVRAADETPKKNSDVPAGYEDAPEAKKVEAKEVEAAGAMEEEADAKEAEVELPAGYEDAGKAGKRKRRARRPLPARPAPIKIDANNPQIKALVAQMRQQLKPFFAAELTFARTVCQPSPEQLQEMLNLATPALEKTILDLAMQQTRQMGFGGAMVGQQKDIGERFEIAASRIVSEVFSPKVVERYEDEQEHRSKFRARAGAMGLVAHLDKRLRLSQDQREALADSLQQEWQRKWQYYLQFLVSNPQYFPPVPDEAVVPHLNEVQAKQWKSMQRTEIGFGWQHLNNHGIFREMQQEFDWFKKPVEGVAGVVQEFAAPAAVIELFVQKDEEDDENKAEEEE